MNQMNHLGSEIQQTIQISPKSSLPPQVQHLPVPGDLPAAHAGTSHVLCPDRAAPPQVAEVLVGILNFPPRGEKEFLGETSQGGHMEKYFTYL